MQSKIIKKTDLRGLVGAVLEDGKTFIGPVQKDRGVEFSGLRIHDPVLLDYGNSLVPVKRHLLPWSETLYEYEEKKPSEVPPANAKTIIFGVRPCDALAVRYMDRVFLAERYEDPYYSRKRDNTVILSLACDEPGDTCFCSSVNGSPTGSEGSDAIIYNIDNHLLFEAHSEKGTNFIERYSVFFADADDSILGKRDDVIDKLANGMSGTRASGIKEKVDALKAKDWEEISQGCIGCGVCTFLCPTCHCFGIHNEQDRKVSSCIRVQDSCQFEQFTLEASAHNPRKTRADRMKQRLMHKFSFSVEKYKNIFCVGCGRCILNCPVNLDVREIIMGERQSDE
jgi:ferredoxin